LSGSFFGCGSSVVTNSRDSTSSVSTASRRVAIALVCACLSPEASTRAAAFRSAAEALPNGADRTSAYTAAPITSTMMTSRRVKPLSRFMAERAARGGSVRDVPVLSFAAFLAVGAEGEQIVGLALSGNGVAIIVAPRILEVGVLRVRPVPLVAAGIAHQRAQVVRVLAHF